jgi:hypothetical protein
MEEPTATPLLYMSAMKTHVGESEGASDAASIRVVATGGANEGACHLLTQQC